MTFKSAMVSVFVLFGLVSQAGAQDELLSLGRHAQLPGITTELERSRIDDLPDLDLRIGLELPTWRSVSPERSFRDQVDYRFGARAPGSLVIKYRGFQGFVMKHLQKRFRREWSKTMHELERETFITHEELKVLRRRNALAEADHAAGGRWWERDWFLSLPPEKGGIHKGVYVHTVGKKVVLFKLGPFSLNNELRAKFDRVALSLGPSGSTTSEQRLFRDPEAPVKSVRADAMLGREIFEPDELDGLDTRRARPSHRVPGVADLWIDVKPVSGRLMENVYWKFKVRPRIRVKVNTHGVRTELRLRASLQIYTGVRTKRLFAEIRANLRYRPLENHAASLTLDIALLIW